MYSTVGELSKNDERSDVESVGARVVGMGGVGLYGRPRSPVVLTIRWMNVADGDGGRP